MKHLFNRGQENNMMTKYVLKYVHMIGCNNIKQFDISNVIIKNAAK